MKLVIVICVFQYLVTSSVSVTDDSGKGLLAFRPKRFLGYNQDDASMQMADRTVAFGNQGFYDSTGGYGWAPAHAEINNRSVSPPSFLTTLKTRIYKAIMMVTTLVYNTIKRLAGGILGVTEYI